MADTVRQRLVDAVRARFAAITTGGGYETNIGDSVFVWKLAPWDVTEPDGVNVMDVKDVIAKEFAPITKEGHRLTIVAECAVRDGTDSAKQARKAIGDIYKAIGVDRTWTVSGTRLAFNTELLMDEIAVIQDNDTFAVARITFEIEYRTPFFTPLTPSN